MIYILMIIIGLLIIALALGLYFEYLQINTIKLAEHKEIIVNKFFEPAKEKHWVDIENNANDAVVQVFAVASKFNWLLPFKSPNQFTITGSGFIISEDGYFVTNSHVVVDAKSVWVQIPSLGRINIDAQVVSVCPYRDLALVKITQNGLDTIHKNIQKLPCLNFGDSNKVHRTDKVLVLGYPLGQHYLKSTTGIVSGREHIKNNFLIQIDAPINQGNSGGPVLNKAGEVIGVTTSMIPTAQNIGYIIPINELKIILDDLYKYPFLRKIDLGISFHNSSSTQANFLKNPDSGGLYIYSVCKNSLAEKAGIKTGDMIYEINGYKIDSYGDILVPWSSEKISLLDVIATFKEGQDVTIVLYRNGQKKEITFKFEQSLPLPIRYKYHQYEDIDYEVFGGMVFMQLSENHIDLLSEDDKSLLKYEKNENQFEPKIIISAIFPGSEVARLDVLIAGDIVFQVNDIEVNTLSELRDALKVSVKTDYVTIKTQGDLFVVLPLSKALDDDLKLADDYGYLLSVTTKYFLESKKR
ncbi:MAG: trypsin-like peptidase domain-containing protein [Candidatus Babeliales bacterium]|nr:trypsin-like peptidase domain-containing protein [Candidatus Babeliales bacterium]